MKRVLIVSPHFPPVNAPDMQRARLALPHLRNVGWEPVVLAVAPEMVEGAVLDPLFEQTYPADVRVVRVSGISPRATRRFGFGSLWFRCGAALRRAGDALLAAEKFDLVFFTTTQFDAFTFGPRWLQRFGVPYVLDYQDPWVNDYYRRTHTTPPGGRIKFALSQLSARRREPAVARRAAAIVSVSAAYGPDLLARYPALAAARIHHLPFGASPSDLELARAHSPAQSLVPRTTGYTDLVYTGRCGPDMERSLRVLLGALRRYRDSHPTRTRMLRLHFIGTGYAPPPLGREWVRPLAEENGVGDVVHEHCYRVPYFDALYYLATAAGLLVVGSDDPTYSASKIFPFLFARRPLLTIAHTDSLMLHLARQQGFTTSYGFPSHQNPADNEALIRRIHEEWFVAEAWQMPPRGDLEPLEAHTALGMTRRLAAIFDGAARAPVA
jgi:hypothetical protein